ncbi:putative excision repair cross-complementing 1 ercc1 [Hibiscus syriacus]|uniref:RING-type E3 ubiquitin transferase n=1 Tax=Hibiscus syriacus TaxID=106335 RepID=A0A6A3ALR9_HIBSY|nr:E3 ubiquitin-protein ligase ATL6-like [Hibiscus syriacus]KAE8705560.1 putative excision repair cross-complementing 1 ercc1 [Hibiscus syriacus]
MSYTAKCGIVALLLFLLSTPPSAAQPTTPYGEKSPHERFSPSLTVILVVLIAALFFICIFYIYIRNCSNYTNGSSVNPVNGRTGSSLRGMRGLEASVIKTFPTMVYSEVKVHKVGKGALECAVCLNEYEDEEPLRLIPKCDHVFHPECIDAWLASHTTCPVCRANLAPQTGEPAVSGHTELNNTEIDLEAQNVRSDSEPEEERRIHNNNNVNSDVEAQVASEVGVIGLIRTLTWNRTRGSISTRTGKPLFTRSHSTGHSMIQPGENTDRFTLRLPADVRNQLINRKLNRATSLVLHKESSQRQGYRAWEDDGSSRAKSLTRLNKSDRWFFYMSLPFFNRASSVESPKVVYNGEGTLSSPVGPVADSSRPQV